MKLSLKGKAFIAQWDQQEQQYNKTKKNNPCQGRCDSPRRKLNSFLASHLLNCTLLCKTTAFLGSEARLSDLRATLPLKKGGGGGGGGAESGPYNTDFSRRLSFSSQTHSRTPALNTNPEGSSQEPTCPNWLYRYLLELPSGQDQGTCTRWNRFSEIIPDKYKVLLTWPSFSMVLTATGTLHPPS